MTDQPRLRAIAETERAGELLAEAVEGLDRPWSIAARAEVALSLEARLERDHPARPLIRWVVAAAVVVLVGSGAFLWVRNARPSHGFDDARVLSLGSEATLEVTGEDAIELPPLTSPGEGRRVVLKTGRVCAEVAHRDVLRDGPLTVEAPRLKIVVVGTHFCVATDGGITIVSVTEGRIRAESPSGGVVSVGAGESVRSDDARFIVVSPKVAPVVPALAPTLVPSPTAPEPPIVAPRCAAAHSVAARRDCYARVARGTDMAAENALYGLGLLERDEAHDGPAALRAWGAYATRFPNGVFAPEASLGALGELLDEKRYPEALAETEHYLREDEENGKARVELVRAQLLLEPMARPADALPLLRRLAELKEPSLREEALFTLGRCLLALGRQDEATETFRRLLAQYPSGAHAAEIRAWTP